MAKSEGYFGLRRGSTKSHTFQVSDGKQITKDRVGAPKNPRTIRQMSQRVMIATIGKAYSEMKAIAPPKRSACFLLSKCRTSKTQNI